MAEYLDLFPAPFLEDIVSNRCIPFIGAGFSRNATIPAGSEMPDWDGLGRKVSTALSGYQYMGPLDAISAYVHEYSRAKLVELLTRTLLVSSSQPGATHKAFCELPFETVVTTNFEFLLERGYAGINRACVPIINEDQLAINGAPGGVRLLKLHGDLHHPSRLVATEEDYDAFLSRYPLLATYLSSLLINSTAWFVGYSLDDPDLRQVWQVVKDRLGSLRRPAYVIQVDARPNVVARYERRGVKVINLPAMRGRSYAQALEIAFSELLRHWTGETLVRSTAAEDEQQAELALPLDARGRLCFLSVPTRLGAFYKSHVYPLVERQGLSPLMALDVVAPGDSIMAKVYALIERAEVIIADASTPNTAIELGMALSREDLKRRLVPILEQDMPVPSDLASLHVLRRPRVDTNADYSKFLNQLAAAVADKSEQLHANLDLEPGRLVAKKEYAAAIIAAFSAFEVTLRNALAARDIDAFSPRFSLRRLLDLAARAELVNGVQVEEMQHVIDVRNAVVHGRARVSASEAKLIIGRLSELEDAVRGLTSQ